MLAAQQDYDDLATKGPANNTDQSTQISKPTEVAKQLVAATKVTLSFFVDKQLDQNSTSTEVARQLGEVTPVTSTPLVDNRVFIVGNANKALKASYPYVY